MRNVWTAIGAALLLTACGKEPAAPPLAPKPDAAVGTVSATATTTVKLAPKEGPWADHQGAIPFVTGTAAGLAKAKAAGKMTFLFYTQHG